MPSLTSLLKAALNAFRELTDAVDQVVSDHPEDPNVDNLRIAAQVASDKMQAVKNQVKKQDD